MKRGDVVLVRFPHSSGQRGKKRPAVVVPLDAFASLDSASVVCDSANRREGSRFYSLTLCELDAPKGP